MLRNILSAAVTAALCATVSANSVQAQEAGAPVETRPPSAAPAPGLAPGLAPGPGPAPSLTPSPAPTPAPAPALGSSDGRYTFYRVQDTFVRLDGRNGQVSLCGRTGSIWTCHAVPEERTALESEIGRLQRENATLKRELLTRGFDLPSGVKPDPAPQEPPQASPSPPVAKAPDPAPAPPRGNADADVERVRSFFEKVWRRLVEMVAELQRDMRKS